MILAGTFSVSGTKMYLCKYSTKDTEIYALISPLHADDRAKQITGEAFTHPEIKDVSALGICYDEGYVVEAIKRRKRTGKIESYGTPNVLLRVMDAMTFARSHKFLDEDISDQSEGLDFGIPVKTFSAKDGELEYAYEERNDNLCYISIKTSTIEFDLEQKSFSIRLSKLPFKEARGIVESKSKIGSLKKITYTELCKVLDMSWYRKDGKNQKNYQSIRSKKDFEIKIIGGMCRKIRECQVNKKIFDVAVDTETSGLKIYNLAPDNPDKDHCVAVPISWEANTGFVIFTDMEHFDNVDNHYVAKRLAEFFENFKGKREISYLEEDSDGNIVRKTLVIKRSDINLIGHNSPFDARVFFDLGVKFYFNNNTLQMAFDLNPVTVRGSKKLKVLTRLFFGHETPELEDILGKGNEDKYRWLDDLEVAEIYGCADADYTLQVFYKLRHLMPDKMYEWYQRQDVPMDNILYQSEYWGMPTVKGEIAKLAKETVENMETLKRYMYEYVGAFIDYSNKVNVLETRYKVGEIESKEELNEAISSIEVDPKAVYEFEMKPAQLQRVFYDVMKYPIKAFSDTGKPKIDKYAIQKLLQDKLEDGERPPRRLNKSILVYGKTYEEYERVKKENSKKAAKMVLVDADEFNKLKYPLALIYQKYTELNKEYTGYYKPMELNNLEDKIFKGYNMARIETRRISNPGQTMKGSLKAIVRSYADDEYLLDFDMAQIEYRIMLSLSHFTPMIQKMCNPESDYHTETASMVNSKPAYRVTKKERKAAKKVSFGVPYGLGDGSMCEGMYGDRSKEHMIDTRLTLFKWRKANKPIVDLLEASRAQALTEWKISDELRDFMGAWKKGKDGEFLLDANGNKIPIPISKCENILGFYRTFSLEGIDLSQAGIERRARGEFTPEEAAIRRKAGNYPIQATAAEIFRIILIRFYEECEKYGIQDKVKWYMLIHDELLCSIKDDVNPVLIYKIVKKACMITMKGHTKYFVGINMGDTWGQCKDDSREAPVYFVERMIKRYDAGEFREKEHFTHPWEDVIRDERAKYVEDRIGEVIEKLQPEFPEKPLKLLDLFSQFQNYTVRAYVNDYLMNGTTSFSPRPGDANDADLFEDLKWAKRLENWAIEHYGDGVVRFVDENDNEYLVTKQRDVREQKANGFVEYVKTEEEKAIEEFGDDFDIDWDEVFEKDGNVDEDDDEAVEDFDLDFDSVKEVYNRQSVDESKPKYETDELEFDFSKKGNDVTAITVIKQRYKYVKLLNEQIVINLPHLAMLDNVKVFLEKFSVTSGTSVIYRAPGMFERGCKLPENFDLDLIDEFIEYLLSNDQDSVEVIGNLLLVKTNRLEQRKTIESVVNKYNGTDYTMLFNFNGKFSYSSSFSKSVSLMKFKDFVDKVIGG